MTCPCENAAYDGYCYGGELCKKSKNSITPDLRLVDNDDKSVLQKERLIELLKNCIEVDALYNGEYIEMNVNYGVIANSLLENGVLIINQ